MDFEIPCPHEHSQSEIREMPDHHPLPRHGVEDMLKLAQRHTGDAVAVSKVQVRLIQAIPGMTCPRPYIFSDDAQEAAVARKMGDLESLFVERYAEGPADDLVDRIVELIGR